MSSAPFLWKATRSGYVCCIWLKLIAQSKQTQRKHSRNIKRVFISLSTSGASSCSVIALSHWLYNSVPGVRPHSLATPLSSSHSSVARWEGGAALQAACFGRPAPHPRSESRERGDREGASSRDSKREREKRTRCQAQTHTERVWSFFFSGVGLADVYTASVNPNQTALAFQTHAWSSVLSSVQGGGCVRDGVAGEVLQLLQAWALPVRQQVQLHRVRGEAQRDAQPHVDQQGALPVKHTRRGVNRFEHSAAALRLVNSNHHWADCVLCNYGFKTLSTCQPGWLSSTSVLWAMLANRTEPGEIDTIFLFLLFFCACKLLHISFLSQVLQVVVLVFFWSMFCVYTYQR